MKSPFLHLVFAALVCAIVGIGYGVWYSAVDAKSVAVAALENQILSKTTAANRIASSRASLASVASDEATIRDYFVPETGVVGFIDALQARGKAQGAAVSVLSVSSATAEQALILSLSISGTFNAVMNTVGTIEYAPYDLTISSLSLLQNKDGWQAQMRIVVGSVSATQTATTSAEILPHAPTAFLFTHHP